MSEPRAESTRPILEPVGCPAAGGVPCDDPDCVRSGCLEFSEEMHPHACPQCGEINCMEDTHDG